MPLADDSPAAGAAATDQGRNPFRRVLVAVDDSDAAGAAASFGIWLAGAAGADVTLLHACPDLRSAEHALPMADPGAFQAAAEQRVAETSEWQRRLQNLEEYAVDGAHVRSWVVRGRAAPAVLEAAEELDSDVIFVGSRGLGSMRARLLGSVSSQLVDHARCSVMVFPARRGGPPAHIAGVVVGIDGSPGSTAAVGAGASLASALDARLVLLAAFENTTALTPLPTGLGAELRRAAASTLEMARASVPHDIEVLTEVREGSPRHVLLEASESFGPSVLIVGARGLGGFGSLQLGSISRWVLHHASCPVLVARSRP